MKIVILAVCLMLSWAHVGVSMTALFAAGIKAFLYEKIDIPGGSATPSVGTSTLQASSMDAYRYWRATYSVEGGSIRFRIDSGTTTVSATDGHLANGGDIIVLDTLSDIRNMRMVQTGSTTTSVQVTYERGISE